MNSTVECQFYHKIGSCRHGNKCIRIHSQPENSPVLVFESILNQLHTNQLDSQTNYNSNSNRNTNNGIKGPNYSGYSFKAPTEPIRLSPEILNMLRELFIEIAIIAPIKEIMVAGNTSPHLLGFVYISFDNEQDAAKVLEVVSNRWFDNRPIFAHYLPAKNIGATLCRDNYRCRRGLDCNYVHPVKDIPLSFWNELFSAQLKSYLH